MPAKETFLNLADDGQWAAWNLNQQAATHVKVGDDLFLEYVLN